MAINSAYDFVGGYEHDSRGGMLHVANHHVSPGKKQWTWGHSDFGQAWDRNLTDEDGPYIELMAGVFTDNQPDFTWLMPNEEKSFTQYFLPYQELGVVKNATKDILLSLNTNGNKIQIKVYVTSAQNNLGIVLTGNGNVLFSERDVNVNPANIYEKEITVDAVITEENLLLTISAANGKELIRYEPAVNKKNELPQPAKPALLPGEITSNEQLFLTGQHLEQYRHATYSPVPYYEKALERDAGDIRCNNALGAWYLRRGQFAKSIPYFKNAIATATQRNANPYDCEPYYNLGLALTYLGRADEAYAAFYKATWDNRWKDSGYFCVAKTDVAKGHWELALEHINVSISFNANNSKAYVVKAAALRNTNQFKKAIDTCMQALDIDPFNLGALYELSLADGLTGQHALGEEALATLLKLSRGNAQNLMAYALDYAAAGLYTEAIELLQHAVKETGTNPLVYYYLAWFNYQGGDRLQTTAWLEKAAAADPYLCFPNRLEEIYVLQQAIRLNPADAKAPYYLGNLFYDKRQYDDAIANWELSVKLDPAFPTVLRNLGIAYFNKRNDAKKALGYFEAAFALDKTDARVLMELDQLYKRVNKTPQERMRLMEANMKTVLLRDDLYLEYASLLNMEGQHKKAFDLIMSRKFHPWEGGEGKASGQYMYSLIELAKEALQKNYFSVAVDLLTQAQVYPHNLGEGKLYGAQENDIFYWLGCAQEAQGNRKEAESYFTKATSGNLAPSAAVFYNDQQPDKIFYQGLAWRKLGYTENATQVFNNLVKYGNEHMHDETSIDYFAVSLPNLLVFEDDLNARNKTHCTFMLGLGYLGLEKYKEAKAAFISVLQSNAEHAGAKTHLNMIAQVGQLQQQS
jgi:tetratricopeptide (TPR) repeat protein